MNRGLTISSSVRSRCPFGGTDPVSGDTIIIDGGDEPQRIIDWVDAFEGAQLDHGSNSASLAEERVFKAAVVALVSTHAL